MYMIAIHHTGYRCVYLVCVWRPAGPAMAKTALGAGLG